MSSMISSYGFHSNFNSLALEISEPITKNVIKSDDLIKSQLKSFNLNQGISTGVSQISMDEEAILHLKKVKDQQKFNMVQLNFVYKKRHECTKWQKIVYFLVYYPFQVYEKIVGKSIKDTWWQNKCQ